jgi:hypothetical protein
MKNLSHGHKALFYTLFYVAIVVGVLLISKGNSNRLPAADARINTIYPFARLASPSCDQIGDVSRLKLFVNGMDSGLRAVGCLDGDAPTASFWLHHESAAKLSPEADQAVWSVILGQPLQTIGMKRTLDYDIHFSQGSGQPELHLAKPGSQFSFYIFEWWSPLAFAAVLLVWGLLIYLARYSALLRDPAGSGTPLENRTFSLAKTQMAWWFAIIFAAVVFLWLVTGEIPALSGQALALLGISSATTVASVGISPEHTMASGHKDVFFHDLMSDANGVTIQRFQMLVMTIALGIMFLFRVATRLTMPEFDPSLLALLGISAGTYLGLKIPENQGAPAKAAVVEDPKSGYAPTP